MDYRDFTGHGNNVAEVNGKVLPWLLSTEECDNLRVHSAPSDKIVFTNLITRTVVRTRGVGIPVRS